MLNLFMHIKLQGPEIVVAGMVVSTVVTRKSKQKTS